jgi:hypothetical protein
VLVQLNDGFAERIHCGALGDLLEDCNQTEIVACLCKTHAIGTDADTDTGRSASAVVGAICIRTRRVPCSIQAAPVDYLLDDLAGSVLGLANWRSGL